MLSRVIAPLNPAADADDLRARFPIGTKLRILPNHACAAGAQFPA